MTHNLFTYSVFYTFIDFIYPNISRLAQMISVFCFSNILKYSYKMYFGKEELLLAPIAVKILYYCLVLKTRQ